MERGQHRGSGDLRIFWAVKSACSFIGVLLRANVFFFFASHREITRHRDGVKRVVIRDVLQFTFESDR